MAVEQSIKNLLLSGPPGCGQTTVILRLLEGLRDLRLACFSQPEISEQPFPSRAGVRSPYMSGRGPAK
jgi:nucleoside-triphosphatase THEP1